MSERGLTLLMIAGYTALMALHALQGHRATRSVTDYYVGGRSMGGVVLGLSFFATYSSTNSFVGFAGQAWSYGLPWLLLVPCILFFVWLAWTAVAPRLRRFTEALESVTIPDFIGFRFESPSARLAAALIVLFASVLYMTAVFKGIGTLLAVKLELSYAASIGLVLLIVMGYTAIGGFVSVVRTDGVQGVLMLIAAVVLFGGTARAAGGVGVVARLGSLPGGERLLRWDAGLPLPLLLGILIAGSMKFVVEPRQLSRFYALRDERALRQGLLVSIGAFALAYALLVPIGLYARFVLPPELSDTDRVVPELLATSGVFSAPVAALLLVAMVAAAMSSLDSVLLVVASTFERDVLAPFRARNDERATLRATRLWVAAFAALTAAVALEPPGGIVALTAFSGSLYAACFFPAVVLGLHWPRGDGASALASFATGIGVLLAWPRLPWAGDLHRVFPALALSTLVYVLLAAARGAPSPRVAALFREAATGPASPGP